MNAINEPAIKHKFWLQKWNIFTFYIKPWVFLKSYNFEHVNILFRNLGLGNLIRDLSSSFRERFAVVRSVKTCHVATVRAPTRAGSRRVSGTWGPVACDIQIAATRNIRDLPFLSHHQSCKEAGIKYPFKFWSGSSYQDLGITISSGI
jgi:hypothetical protein